MVSGHHPSAADWLLTAQSGVRVVFAQYQKKKLGNLGSPIGRLVHVLDSDRQGLGLRGLHERRKLVKEPLLRFDASVRVALGRIVDVKPAAASMTSRLRGVIGRLQPDAMGSPIRPVWFAAPRCAARRLIA